ncbi:WXG100 family type VII secretion target [Streptomyces sp. 8N114]|uniref:WXG100 family type VII secretion target n=1 Tax=Streptomyces sp. 8N114 TaxID=3457419 RepID=UPI003FD5DD82
MAEDPLSSLKVNYSHLDEIAQQINIRKKLVEQQMRDLWAEVKKVDQAWDGEAREMFNAIEKQWQARANDISTQLAAVEKVIRHGSPQYQATDKKAASLFEQIKGL